MMIVCAAELVGLITLLDILLMRVGLQFTKAQSTYFHVVLAVII